MLDGGGVGVNVGVGVLDGIGVGENVGNGILVGVYVGLTRVAVDVASEIDTIPVLVGCRVSPLPFRQASINANNVITSSNAKNEIALEILRIGIIVVRLRELGGAQRWYLTQQMINKAIIYDRQLKVCALH